MKKQHLQFTIGIPREKGLDRFFLGGWVLEGWAKDKGMRRISVLWIWKAFWAQTNPGSKDTRLSLQHSFWSFSDSRKIWIWPPMPFFSFMRIFGHAKTPPPEDVSPSIQGLVWSGSLHSPTSHSRGRKYILGQTSSLFLQGRYRYAIPAITCSMVGSGGFSGAIGDGICFCSNLCLWNGLLTFWRSTPPGCQVAYNKG